MKIYVLTYKKFKKCRKEIKIIGEGVYGVYASLYDAQQKFRDIAKQLGYMSFAYSKEAFEHAYRMIICFDKKGAPVLCDCISKKVKTFEDLLIEEIKVG